MSVVEKKVQDQPENLPAALVAGREAIRKAYTIPPDVLSRSSADIQALRDEMAQCLMPELPMELADEGRRARSDALACLDEMFAGKVKAEQMETKKDGLRRIKKDFVGGKIDADQALDVAYEFGCAVTRAELSAT
jgi:hypothetical protein